MLILAKIAVINFFAFMLVLWFRKAIGKKEVSLNTGVFLVVWMAVSALLLFVTVAWFIWSL